MARSVVYFEEVRGFSNRVYVGYSSNPKLRQKTHRSNGKRRLAAVPGTSDDESALHRDLMKYRVRIEDCGNDSTYQGEAVIEYIEWLVGRGYAYTTDERCEQAPLLPYDIWCFHNRNRPFEDPDGQLRLSKAAPRLRERVALESEFATKTSLSDDWFTPPFVIEMAREVLGDIDTDPASCAAANEWINARVWYSREIDGLNPQHPWRGRVWLNPPYGRGEYSARAFVERLEREYLSGSVSAAITCLNADSMTSLWFDPLWRTATVHVMWRGRLSFIPPRKDTEVSSPSKGSVFSYFGTNCAAFKRVFGARGNLIVRLNNG